MKAQLIMQREPWRGNGMKSHTANLCERAKNRAGNVKWLFMRVKRPAEIVGSLFEEVKSLSVDMKSLFVNVKILLVKLKSLSEGVKRVAFMHRA
jgi:hypothetical protein